MKNTWKKPPETISLSSSHVDIWLCALDLPENEVAAYYEILSVKEQHRANQFIVPQKRNQFIISRGMLRHKLAQMLEDKPNKLSFTYNTHGKPCLLQKNTHQKISFNISHSHNLALIAITLDHEIGVDIEKINHKTDHSALVKRFFSSAEAEQFKTFSKDSQPRAFFAGWTRKEAFIKGVGKGVAFGLDTFDIHLDPNTEKPSIQIHHPLEIHRKWQIRNLPINDQFMAALAVSNENIKPRLWQNLRGIQQPNL